MASDLTKKKEDNSSMPSSSRSQKNLHLRRERLLRNWRQQDLADQLETSPNTVKRWENGWQPPGAYFRARLCILFGKSAMELGLLPDEPPLTPSFDEHAGLWMVPYMRNLHFTGREELLSQLTHALFSYVFAAQLLTPSLEIDSSDQQVDAR